MASASSTSAMTSRTKDKIFLVGYPNHQITGCKLPSKRQVLATLFYNLRSVKMNLQVAAKTTIQEVLVFWAKARIPTKQGYHATKALQKLYAQWRNIQKEKNKKLDLSKNKINEFALTLDHLFDIAHQDALTIMKSEEDKAFLVNQREPGRPGCMIGIDKGLARKEERQLANQRSIVARNNETESFDIESVDEEEDIYEGTDNVQIDSSSSQSNEALPGPSSSKRKRGTREFLTTKLSLILDRCGISDRNATRILVATIEALGHNPDEFVVSRSIIREKRRFFREKYTERIMGRVDVSDKEAVVVHWDSKLLPHVLRTEQKERIAVLISHTDKEQLLGVPLAESSTGEEQAMAVYECLEEWGLTNSVKAMCFDTTPSNTGRLKGACTILEKLLDRELLYFACRHHLLEVLLKGVFDVKLGSTTGPHSDLFQRFEKAWAKLDKSKFDTGVSNKNVAKHLPAEVIDAITSDFNAKLMETQPRDDYKELLQLVLVFVGALNGSEVGFKAPGAISHARWMAKAIYCLKIFMFRGQFKLTNRENSSLQAICIFLVRVYCKAWFNAPKAQLAPKQDLEMLKSLSQYDKIDKDIANRGLVKFSNHLWYLNAETVGLAFFDSTLPNEETSKMAEKICAELETESSENSRVVNPKLQKHQLKELVQGGLSVLITKETLHLFERLQINPAFLKEPPSSWQDNKDYREGLAIVESLKVVNDFAERGVKLITDFNKLLTKDEEQKQFILQVVSECRKLYPDESKSTLSKPLD